MKGEKAQKRRIKFKFTTTCNSKKLIGGKVNV
jgi:hypothetical protein